MLTEESNEKLEYMRKSYLKIIDELTKDGELGLDELEKIQLKSSKNMVRRISKELKRRKKLALVKMITGTDDDGNNIWEYRIIPAKDVSPRWLVMAYGDRVTLEELKECLIY